MPDAHLSRKLSVSQDPVAVETSALLPQGEERRMALQIFEEALHACSIEQAFAAKLVAFADGSSTLQFAGGPEVDLSAISRVLIIAMGKGAARMLRAFLHATSLSERYDTAGILIAPQRPADLPGEFTWFAGGHPLPNEQSFEAARAAQDLLRSAADQDEPGKTFCFFLISGGASAMMELPLHPEVSLADTVAFHRALVHSGGSIAEINCVRKHFSAVKGGRLLAMLGGQPSLTIAVSDVPAGRLDALASGPTMPDSSTVEECRRVLDRHGLLPQFPASVRTFFESADLPETPKPAGLRATTYALLSSDDFAEAARQSAERMGFTTIVDNTCDDWDFRDAADYLLRRFRSAARKGEATCLISTGEVTVQLPSMDGEQTARSPSHGVGGRNLHFAAYSALQIQPADRVTILSAGSDGIDGNSPATGAVVDASTATGHRLELERALADFDSYGFLSGAGCALVTGPTGNNIRDIRVLIALPG